MTCRGVLSEAEQSQIKEYSEKFFAWGHRQEKLLEEIRRLDADILSLVELDVYEEFFDALSDYDAAFQKRPRRSSPDGCGIFWRRSKFSKVAENGFVYDDRTPKEGGGEKKRQDRCGLLVLLQSVQQPSRKLIVLSTHLARNPVTNTTFRTFFGASSS